jgi:Zn finger protein HypA/HybF involved in hydrogenase expression
LTLEELLTENSNVNRANLKARLIRDGLIENKCAICSLPPIWNNKPLSLTLDHINGISDDNRLHNLRLLCPNCHSQTETFAGKRHRKLKPIKPPTDPNWRFNEKFRKVVRPTKEEFSKMLWEIPSTEIAKRYGVSSKAIEKWAKSYNLEKPPRGYWAKKKFGKL